jgi:hypothetical protein
MWNRHSGSQYRLSPASSGALIALLLLTLLPQLPVRFASATAADVTIREKTMVPPARPLLPCLRYRLASRLHRSRTLMWCPCIKAADNFPAVQAVELPTIKECWFECKA